MKKLTKAEAGRLGGLTTSQLYGPEHFSRIGKLGAQVTWRRYTLIPYGLNWFAFVSRETGEIIRIRRS